MSGIEVLFLLRTSKDKNAIQALQSTSESLKNSICRLFKKISEAYEGNGMLEYWNIEVVGFERINPSFHPSTIPSL